jgi:hypothetical protein
VLPPDNHLLARPDCQVGDPRKWRCNWAERFPAVFQGIVPAPVSQPPRIAEAAPDDHLTSRPDRRVLVSRDRLAGGVYRRPAIGGRYDPAANLWRPMTLIGAPAGRTSHTAVWTGNEMIVYGGQFSVLGSLAIFGDTFSYSPPRASVSPGIGGLARDGSDLTISFPTVANCIYTLWRSDSLADGSWINTGLPPIVGTGSLRSFAVSISDASGFFRVQLGP